MVSFIVIAQRNVPDGHNEGIWDCLSSQQAVNVVRLLISQGKRLPQVCEEICELCLAPDTTTGAGIGCDNMTIMIVALLNGKSQDEWYAWVTDRVQNKIGYQTPETLPQLYSTSRLMSFKVKREAYEQRQRERREREERDRENGITPAGESSGSLFGGFANILGGDGSLILHPGADDDDEEDSDDDDIEGHGINARSLLSSAGFGFGQPVHLDVTKSLREQLQELDDMSALNDHDIDMNDIDDEESGEHDPHADGHHGEAEAGASEPESPTYIYDGNSTSGSASSHTLGSRGGETPPPPPTPPNGDATPVQLKSLPQGDEPSAAVKLEGLMDASESPLKV